MSWEAVGAVGEVVGGLAVVVTLLYLAIQIRQNTRAQSVTALRDTTAQWNQWGQMLAQSPDLAEIAVRGNESFEGLSAGERLRYTAWVQSFFDNAESYYSLIIHHGDARDIAVLESIVARRMVSAGWRACWASIAADYDAAFVTWVKSLELR